MRYFLWLLPEPKAAIYWNGVIHRLAKIYNQIPHLAHVTLASWDRAPDLGLLDETDMRALTLQIGTPQVGANPWQRLYVSVGPREKLMRLDWVHEERLKTPHLSLLYGNHSQGRCIDLKRNLVLPSGPLLFSQLALIQGTKDVASWIELKRWELKCESA